MKSDPRTAAIMKTTGLLYARVVALFAERETLLQAKFCRKTEEVLVLVSVSEHFQVQVRLFGHYPSSESPEFVVLLNSQPFTLKGGGIQAMAKSFEEIFDRFPSTGLPGSCE